VDLNDPTADVSERSITTKHLGLTSFAEAFSMQCDIQQQILSGQGSECILSLEHPNTLSFGKNADTKYLLADQASIQRLGCEIIHTDRGGEVTAHVPGQLVVYPILDLGRRRLMPKKYVHLLEQAVIDTLIHFGIHSNRDPVNPGVWVGKRKICALGIRVRNHISMHGLALNIANSLEVFDLIVACGIQGRGVTTMSLELGKKVDFESVRNELVDRIKLALTKL
jgi:lipoate-protein ligase B